MTRSEMVKRLINEGLSAKTLVNFSDNQLRSLCNRMISEQPITQQNKIITTIDTKTPEGKKAVADLLNNPKVLKGKYEVKEGKKKPTEKQLSVLDKNKNKKIDKQDTNESLMGIGYAVIADKLKEKLGKNPTHDEINRELEKLRKELEKSYKKDTNKKSEVKEGEKWIQKAIHPSKKGSLKKALGVKKDEKIPETKLKSAAKKGGKLGQRARLAMTLKKLKENQEVSEWINNLAETNYHPFTSKGEIMELLQRKLYEQPQPDVAEPEVLPDVDPGINPNYDPDSDPFIDPFDPTEPLENPNPKMKGKKYGDLPDSLKIMSLKNLNN